MVEHDHRQKDFLHSCRSEAWALLKEAECFLSSLDSLDRPAADAAQKVNQVLADVLSWLTYQEAAIRGELTPQEAARYTRGHFPIRPSHVIAAGIPQGLSEILLRAHKLRRRTMLFDKSFKEQAQAV